VKRYFSLCLVVFSLLVSAAIAVPPPRQGEVRLELTDKEPTVAELFPSPVVTPHPENNTVHCEYFRPVTPGKHPAVIALHILGGDFDLSRLFCRHLAQHGVAALFLKLPYYGPRRPANSDVRMITEDPNATVANMRQGILDIRRGAAWLCAQDEVDRDRLGIFGISLGGITSALASTAEPRFGHICLMLAGGDMGKIAWESPEVKDVRERWLARGGTKGQFYELLKQIDPVTYGDRVRDRKILMLNASHDEVIPKVCTESLWHAFGEPEIEWMDAGHYSAMRYIFTALTRVTKFFKDEQPPAAAAK
jgi:cephalosporin-C deacetylase-like acetyl esterase